MSDERRYNEEEVSNLLARAAARAELATLTDGTSPATTPFGLTLAQIQEIATTVGISADAVARAAAAEARGELVPTTRRMTLGIPFGVSRQVELPRMMTDGEWERVVIRLRETFAAEGKVTREGSIRGWRNGNLRVVLEPTNQGSRIRMSTVRTDAAVSVRIASVTLAGSIAGAGWLALTAAHAGLQDWGAIAMLGGVGIGFLARNLFALPRWARIRSKQMEELSEEIGEIVDGRG